MSLSGRAATTARSSQPGRLSRLRHRARSLAALTAIAGSAIAIGASASASAQTTAPDQPTLTAPAYYVAPKDDGLGIAPGKIKHIWMIVLENKSYDATFTGLNDNNYLWQTLPSQGALLQNYYGTGHSSQDNYIALAQRAGASDRHPGRLRRLRRVLGFDRHLAARSARTRTTASSPQPPGRTRSRTPTAASIRRV